MTSKNVTKVATKVACVQLSSGPDIHENMSVAADAVREAASNGAKFIASPENTGAMILDLKKKIGAAFTEEDSPAIPFFSDLARETEIWLLIGSLAPKVSGARLANRSYLFSPEGQVFAKYQKIHMFDVDLDTGESHRESEIMEPGKETVLVNMPWAAMGLAICYDMRFPHMFRDLAKQGAQVLAIPSAFTVPTGKAHWHAMLRARAIETGCFVIAPAQCGEHDGGRKTYGHSLIVDPWGRILAEAGEQPGIIYADIDLSLVDQARQSIQQLRHDREYEIKKVGF